MLGWTAPFASRYGILLISLATTFAGWYLASEVVRERAAARFNAKAEATARLIERQAEHYEAALYGVRGLFESSEEVTADEFRLYINITGLLKNYPGLTGIGYAVADSGTQNMRTLFMEPSLGIEQITQPAFLLDGNRRAALEQARDSGHAAITGLTLLRQIGRPGFLLLIPIYKSGVLPTTVESRRTAFVGAVFGRIEAGFFLQISSRASTFVRWIFLSTNRRARIPCSLCINIPGTLRNESPSIQKMSGFR